MADPASISALVASWFTPSSLFLLVNLVIGTIAITSRLASSKRPHIDESSSPSPHLVRSSSLLQYDAAFSETHSLLERVRSFNFGLCNNNQTESVNPSDTHHGDPTALSRELARTPSLLERLKSLYRSDSIVAATQVEFHAPEAKRSKSESEKESPLRLRKSASEKTASRRWEEDEDEEQDARVESGTASFGEDEAVDAKADDFINKFKQQLRLQRLDSILRYRPPN